MMLRMSPLPRSLMKRINYRSRGFYDPERAPASSNTIVAVVACALFFAAAFYSISTTLDQQQRQHCEQGWQPACEKLK